MTDQISPWLTVPEAAARARCGPRTIQRAIKHKHLRATRVGGRNLMLAQWVDAWVTSPKVPHQQLSDTIIRKAS